VSDHLHEVVRRLDTLERRLARIEPPATREPTPEQLERWTGQVDQAVSTFRRRAKSAVEFVAPEDRCAA
jgi:hypothetical protein